MSVRKRRLRIRRAKTSVIAWSMRMLYQTLKAMGYTRGKARADTLDLFYD